MKQQALFEITVQPAPACPEDETTPNLSEMRDSKSVRRLVSVLGRLQREREPIARARLATEIRDLAEGIVESSIREANALGLTWREIGAKLGMPFQTLHRRYGAGE